MKALETQLNADATSKHRAGRGHKQGRLALSPLQTLSQEKARSGADSETGRMAQRVSRKRPLNADAVHDRAQQSLPPLLASSSSSTDLPTHMQSFPQAARAKQSVSLTALTAAADHDNSDMMITKDAYTNSSVKAQRRGSGHVAASMQKHSQRNEHAAFRAGALSSDGALSTIEVRMQ